MDSNKLWIFIHVRVQVVFPMDNIWIEPWAIYPHYMDPTLQFLLSSLLVFPRIIGNGDIHLKATNRGKILFLGPRVVALSTSLPGHFSSWNLIIKLNIYY